MGVSEPRVAHGDPRLPVTPTAAERQERTGFERYIWRTFGWHPRGRHSCELIVVPVAMLEEARDSLPRGDARGLVETLLQRGVRI